MNVNWYKSYDTGIPQTIHPANKTLYEYLQDYAKTNPEKDIYICLGKKIKSNDFLNLVDRIANALLNQNINKGERVAIILPNLIQFPAFLYACVKIGAILVPINPLLTSREISKTLKLANPKILIFLDLFLDKINGIESNIKIPILIKTKITDISTLSLKLIYPASKIFRKQQKYIGKNKIYSFKNFLSCEPKEENIPENEINNTAVLLSTGGTTGVPKLATLTNFSIVSNAQQISEWVAHLKADSILLAALPLFHSFGLTICLNVCLLKKFTVVLVPKFKTKTVLKLIKKHHVSLMPGVPIMFAAISKYLSKTKILIPSLRECFSGGTELVPDIQDEFERLTHAKIIEAYGLTEASPAVTCNPTRGKNKQGSIGIPLPSSKVKIINIKDGSEQQTDEVGEIAVKGPQLMTGYWKNESESKKVFQDGWLLTGDLGKMDNEGYIFITGRKKEMITHCGFKIYPQEVEKVLVKHKDIVEAGVCAIPDGYKGEAVKAVVVLQENATVSKEEIIDHCKNNLAPFKIPKEIEFTDALPKSFLGKVVRRLLNEPA